MKNIFKLSILSASLLLISACGSSSGHVSGSSDELEYSPASPAQLNAEKTQLNMSLTVNNNYPSDVEVQLKDLKIAVAPCTIVNSVLTPTSLMFNDESNSVITADLTFSEACTPTAYSLNGTKELTLNGETRKIDFETSPQTFDDSSLVTAENNQTTGGSAGSKITYTFKNVTPLIVKDPSKGQELSVDLIDISNVGVSGKTIKITTIDNKFGSFGSSTAQTNGAGRATFTYVSPNNIEPLIGQSTSATLTFSENGDSISEPVTIRFQNSDSNNTDINNTDTNTSADTINYGIKFSLEDEDVMKFNLEDKKSIQISLIDKDTGNVIPNNKVISIKVNSKQENLLKLFDASANATPVAVLSYEKRNNITIYAQTYTRSGLADIDVEIEYTNDKGSIEKVSKTYSTMVQSGPPTAFSINTAGVSYNFETKWFENKFLISGVDRYNNIVNISPTIYVSAMTGFTRDSNGKELLYGNFGNVEGKLNVDKDSKTATFEANSTVFDNIDVNRDYLYVFGQVDDYEALGKWDIDSFATSHTKTTLALSEDFNGENHDNLGFALGHNYIIDPGSSESGEWQVKIDSTDGKYQLDAEGKAFVTMKFPTYLVGKRTALAVNFLGKTPETGKILRSGEVKFKTLRSFLGVTPPAAITIPENTQGTVSESRTFYIDTGTEDSWVVKNSHVSCITETNNVHVVGFAENKIVNTVEEFKANNNSYYAFHQLTLELIDSTKAGTYSFKECQVRTLPLF